jgi:hypothetical protein
MAVVLLSILTEVELVPSAYLVGIEFNQYRELISTHAKEMSTA